MQRLNQRDFGGRDKGVNDFPIVTVRLFLFLFIGGLAGLGYLGIGGDPELVPLVIGMAGLGALAAARYFA